MFLSLQKLSFVNPIRFFQYSYIWPASTLALKLVVEVELPVIFVLKILILPFVDPLLFASLEVLAVVCVILSFLGAHPLEFVLDKVAFIVKVF